MQSRRFSGFYRKSIESGKFEVDGDVYKQFIALGYAEPYIVYNCITDKYHIDNKLTVKNNASWPIPPNRYMWIRHAPLEPACFSLP